jgi:hypothetical protein
MQLSNARVFAFQQQLQMCGFFAYQLQYHNVLRKLSFT